MDKIALILPTKGRPELLKRFIESYNANRTEYSKVFPVIDDSEVDTYNVPCIQTSDGNGLVSKLNLSAELLWDMYDYIGFAADDLVVKTPEFDRIIVEYFKEHPEIKIIHVGDELHNGTIANHWFIRSSVVRDWGFFIPPVFKHLFIDNFITTIGKDTKTIAYLDNVIIEHRHYINKKAEMDATYKISSTKEIFNHDQTAFKDLMASEKYNLLKKILCK